MQQTRQQKKELVASVSERIKDSKALVFANFKGVSVKDLTAIRKSLAKTGSSWKVLKKTLLNIALKDAGIDMDAKGLNGQIGVAFSKDEVSAAKVFSDFSKANKDTTLALEGGTLGMKKITVAEIKALAKLPGLDELRGKLVGTLQAPITSFVRVMNGNLSGLVRVLKAIEEKKS